MKPFEILSAIPKWAKLSPEQILDAPAFALPCRLGEESATLRFGAVHGGDTINLAVAFGDEPHLLRLSRSSRFAELDKIWDARADVPEPILLALVEKDCGPLLQALENAVRRQLRLVGLSAAPENPDEKALFAQIGDVIFSLTRSGAVVSSLGSLRNLDLSDPSFRDEVLVAERELAIFALPAADLVALAVGDALLLPEVGSVPSRLVVDGRFVVDETGVSAFSDDGRCRVVAADPCSVSLGELFAMAEDSESRKSKLESPASASETLVQLRLVQNGKTVARGRLDRVGDHPAFVAESLTA